ncbi:hypothetical protein PRIPAC_75754, partial [Pristionchus pacificus]|uniref:Uncharacterized protein n=1 Tax=Pristionchus pacificus TaxID=54126 RepID=A0A2A6CSL6_PRIPA
YKGVPSVKFERVFTRFVLVLRSKPLVMGKKSGDEEYSQGGDYEKDSRRARKREEEAKAHHIWYERTGPSVIIRSQLGGTRTSFEAEDAFDISCDNVPHSLNKGKRWEKAQNAEQILYEQNSSGRTSFVDASVPGYPSRLLIIDPTVVGHEQLIGNKGGVNKYVEVEDGEISVRKAKSTRTNISSLQSNEGPGPRLKKNRHRARTVKGGEKEEEGVHSDPSEEGQHTRYSTLEVKKRDPKSVERSWRWCQTQRSYKQGWTRKPAADHVLDWYSEHQDALEDELDAFYEEQLDSEEPLRLPDLREKNVEKLPEMTPKEEKEDEFPLRETKLQRRQRREKVMAELEEQEYRDRIIEIRPSLTAQHMEDVFVKAKEHFDKVKVGDCLPVFPRTIIIHKEESEKILGTKMNRCTFVAASNVPGEVNLYSAPRFCCSAIPPLAQPVDGWQSHARNELERLAIGESDRSVPSSSLFECPLCKKTEETEELGDAVVIKHPHLFSFSCGHVACLSCWLAHAKQNARAHSTSITCVNPHCGLTSCVSEAAAIFSDGTLGIFRDFWWDSLCDQEGSVPCYACPRLLIPLKSSYTAAALCVCGARTCKRCGLREHLPLSCSLYSQWAAMNIREGFQRPKAPHIRNPHRHLTPREKTWLKNCYICGAEDTMTGKSWCDKCMHQVSVRFEDPVNTKEDLIPILEARARMMNTEYKQAKIDRRLIDKKKSLAMEKIVEDGVFLFELIKLARQIGVERALRRKTDKIARMQLERMEDTLDSFLFSAMQTGGDPEKKTGELKMKIEQTCGIVNSTHHSLLIMEIDALREKSLEKDSRGEKNREEEARAHHVSLVQNDLEAESDAIYAEYFDSGESHSLSYNKTIFEQMCEERMKTRNRRNLERKRAKKSISMKEEEERVHCSSFLSPVKIIEKMHEKAKIYYQKNYLPRRISRTVYVHAPDSEKILGVALNRSSYITSSRVPGKVTVYLSPSSPVPCSSYVIMPLATRKKYEPEVLDVYCIRKWSTQTVSEKIPIDGIIDLRHPISSSQHTENLFVKAKEHFNMAEAADCLLIFPRTIIAHKDQVKRSLERKWTDVLLSLLLLFLAK